MIFMFILKHLCAIKCLMATFLKPKILKFKIYGRQYKSNCIWNSTSHGVIPL